MDRLPWYCICIPGIPLIPLILFTLSINVDSAKIPEGAASTFGSTTSINIRNNQHKISSEYGFGEPATVNFLTTVRRRRDVIKNDYHIVKIDLPQSNTSFSVHLVKDYHSVSPELPVLVHNGNSTISVSDKKNYNACLYIGTTTMESNEITNNNESYGTAAISLCNNNNGSRTEINGLLIVGAEHFVIQPSEETQSKNLTSQMQPHTVFRISNSKTRKHDVLRVPQKELEKAIEKMKSRNAELEKGTSNTEGSDSDSDDYQDGDYNNDAEQSLSEHLNMPAQMVMNSQSKKEPSSKPNTNNGKKYIIEVAVFTDAALFRKLKMKTSKETIKRVKNVALTVVNNMNLLYKLPSMGVDLTFRLIHLEIMKSNPKKMNTHDGLASKYLSSFCKYAGDKNTKGDLWDHALMLTGLNIQEDGDDLTAGLAWADTMCLQYWSCSLSEGYSFGSVFITAHEVGHSLGMEHDGYGPSSTCDPELYLMSATTGIGKVTWSTCSTSNVKQFIKTGSPIVGKTDSASKPSCLTKTSPISNKAVKFRAKRLPGQIFEASNQCRLECGENCKPYQKFYSPYNDVCAMLFCEATTKDKGKYVAEAHPALEGTECGNGKYCRGGKCVKVGSQPK